MFFKNLVKSTVIAFSAFVILTGYSSIKADAYLYSYTEDSGISKPVITVGDTLKDSSTNQGFYFNAKPFLSEEDEYYLYVDTSNNSKFEEDSEKNLWADSDRKYESSSSIGNYYQSNYNYYGEPGEKIYMRAYYVKDGKRSKYSNVITYTNNAGTAYISSLSATKTSVELKTYTNFSYAEVYRSIQGGKFKLIDKISTNTFKDTGLAPGKKYAYKLVPYYQNIHTGAMVKGNESSVESIYTKAARLIVKTKSVSAKKIKLTWNKIKGAKYYEIYRYEGYSSATRSKDGYDDSYVQFKKIAKVKKNKKAYVDKKISPYTEYSYEVRAVFKGNLCVSGSAYGNSLFHSPYILNTYYKNANTKVVEIKPMSGVKNFVLEKYTYDKNKKEWSWKKYKTFSGKTTKFTLGADSNIETTSYRIYAKNGKYVSEATSTISVTQKIASPKVTAKATNEGIKISWSAVKGATYYTVTAYNKASLSNYNGNLKCYEYVDYNNSNTVYQYKNITKTEYGYSYETDYSGTYKDPDITYDGYEGESGRYTKTNVEWKYVPQNDDYYAGPKPGKQYGFIVRAYVVKKDVEGNEYTLSSDGWYNNISTAIYKKQAAPKATKISKLTNKKGKKAILKMKKVKGATYVIYRSTKKKSGYTRVAATTKNTYTDSGLKKKKTYYYKVKVLKVNTVGEIQSSGFSKVKSVKIRK